MLGQPRFLVYRWLFLLATVLLATPCARADEAASLDEVRDRYAESLNALLPLWTLCEWSQYPASKEFAEGPGALEPREGTLVEWAVDGDKWHFSHSSPLSKRWMAYDARSVWELAYDKEDKQAILAAEKYSLSTRSDFVLRIGPTVGQWIGLYIGINDDKQSGATLRHMLNDDSAEWVGEEDVGGHACIRIELMYPTPGGERLPLTAWLDPSAGYLPRRIQKRFYPGGQPEEILVDTFLKLDAGNGSFPFIPQEMRRTTRTTTNVLRLIDVKFGESQDQDLFRPVLPAGVPVFDMENPDQANQHGAFLRQARAARPDVPPRQGRSAPTPLPASVEPTQYADPNPGPSWTTIFACLGVILLIAASWQIMRR